MVAPGDWTSPTNDGLWQDGSKTLFDPCPAGWRVPRSGAGAASPWNAFGTDPYAAPFFYYINGVKQTANGTPAFVLHPNNGRRYENSGTRTWHPSPGFRDAGDNGLFGALGGVGNDGYNWSSTISGTKAMNLSFARGWIGLGNPNNRANGFSVRCVRE